MFDYSKGCMWVIRNDNNIGFGVKFDAHDTAINVRFR